MTGPIRSSAGWPGSGARSTRCPGRAASRRSTGAEPIAPGVLLAGPQTRVRDRDVHFGESRMSAYLGEPTLLVTIDAGPAAIAAGLGGGA